MSFSSCIMCGFGSYTVNSQPPLGGGFSVGTLEKYDIQIKSAHDTGTERQHQPCSCSHQNHYVISATPQHGDSTTVD